MNDHPTPELDSAVRLFYERWPEEDRLQQGLALLEAERTRRLIARHAPPAPAVILDIGGAGGAYAAWLAEVGYTVHLVDPVPRLVGVARRRNVGLRRPIASCEAGDARRLPFRPGIAGAALLLGPLYHLGERADRSAALAEVRRVLEPGGMLFAAAITRWASAFDGLVHDRFADPHFGAIVARDLEDGQHRNPPGIAGYFTTAYFHRPEEFRAELDQAGFVVEALYGLEGPASLLPDFAERWSDPRRRADLIRIAEAIESEPALLGLSAHLLAVASAPKAAR